MTAIATFGGAFFTGARKRVPGSRATDTTVIFFFGLLLMSFTLPCGYRRINGEQLRIRRAVQRLLRRSRLRGAAGAGAGAAGPPPQTPRRRDNEDVAESWVNRCRTKDWLSRRW